MAIQIEENHADQQPTTMQIEVMVTRRQQEFLSSFGGLLLDTQQLLDYSLIELHAMLTKILWWLTKVDKQIVWFTVCTGTVYGTFVEEYLYQHTNPMVIFYCVVTKKKKVYCLQKVKVHSKSR